MWHEKMIDSAKQIVRSGKPLRPVFLMLTQGQMSVADIAMLSDHKEEMTDILKLIVMKEDPDEYLLILESFIKQIDVKDPSESAMTSLLLDGTLSVSQLPSAQDCITFVYGDRRGEKIGHIIFKKGKKGVTFQPLQWHEGEAAGRFVGLRVSM